MGPVRPDIRNLVLAPHGADEKPDGVAEPADGLAPDHPPLFGDDSQAVRTLVALDDAFGYKVAILYLEKFDKFN